MLKKFNIDTALGKNESFRYFYGKKLKKCSTAGWDRATRTPTGCTYVEWLKAGVKLQPNGEEFLPPED